MNNGVDTLANSDTTQPKQHRLDKKIISVKELLEIDNLCIPEYQRPYKWTEKHLNQLLEDLRYYRSKNKKEYRLGSIVFHLGEDKKLNIVDGQQRTLTLFLLVKALLEVRENKLENKELTIELNSLRASVNKFIGEQSFNSDISHQNLYNNYQVAKRAVARPDFTKDDVQFFLNNCQLVSFVLADISEAFQFFDSQNSRGRDLDPHDLLKAFHLREFTKSENSLKAEAVSGWESMDSKDLSGLFALYLFRIRNWSQGKPARYFTKNEVDIFKGINIDQIQAYPYAETLRITHDFIDSCNRSLQLKTYQGQMLYPFQLNARVINGRRFFEMVGHYQKKIDAINSALAHKQENKQAIILGVVLEEQASEILSTLNDYPARFRTGDRYVRNMFDCAVIFYIDKFGTEMLSQVIEKLFVWAYRCRLEMRAVQLATADNYVLNDNIFRRIKEAVCPADLLNWSPKGIGESDVKATGASEIINLFKDMKYCG